MPPKTLNGPRLYLRLLSHVRPYWRQFAGALAGISVLAATEPLLPALAKPLLDESFVAKDPSGLVWVPIAITGLILLRGVADYAGAVGMSWVAGKVVLDLRESMFRRLLELPTTFFDQHPSGTIISKVTFDVTRLTNAATDVLTVIVRDSLAILGLLGWMFYVNWQLTLVTFTVLPAIVAIIWVINKRLRHLARSTQRQYGDMTHILQEATEGHRIIKIFGGQSYETNRFHKSANWIRRFQVKSKAAGAMNAPLVQAVVAVGYHDNHPGPHRRVLLVRNSWGACWGQDGYGVLPAIYVEKQLAADFWTLITPPWCSEGVLCCPPVPSLEDAS